MADWIVHQRYRFMIVVCVYFALHICIRTTISGSLDFDESEQVFLSQWTLLGYNSQPPLYTWMQQGLLYLLGDNVFSLALLKNALLAGTYFAAYGIVKKATDNPTQAVVASLGIMTIPQIAWESHRDLSHTVAVTFATVALVYCVVSLEKSHRTAWYAAIGMVTAFGIMSKYNFAIVVLAVAIAALSVPNYRQRLFSPRILWTIIVAGSLIAPHGYWIANHHGLASKKTVSTLAGSRTSSWFDNVIEGLDALASSAFACCVLTVFVFIVAYRASIIRWIQNRNRIRKESSHDSIRQTTLFVERFLIVVAFILLMIVLSGHAIEFKNRWLQPFVALLPAYLVLRFRNFASEDHAGMNRVALTSFLLMATVLIAVSSRPLLSSYRHKHILLNVPFDSFAESVRERCGQDPAVIVVPDMRWAGNLKIQFPSALVLSRDNQHVADQASVAQRIQNGGDNILVVSNGTESIAVDTMKQFVNKTLRRDIEALYWQTIDHPYYYGSAENHSEFTFARLNDPQRHIGEVASASSASDLISAKPTHEPHTNR
ncbi:Dolichyl-phosphate-mannose-protein mannosyltransferase [Planctomycetes bacterium CA13]|uniref:Dolichyl-phosphate-mannose-protein mannosyltransferase n=1 Tax=Novipirellula herctigrandis TaxID=2527986 RepID=A0A5C5Z9Y0_9BACT|nr:Dolichyl-phosphate-mannose-protein mannosyltransferase [Planctomycetes bacterium CA13]